VIFNTTIICIHAPTKEKDEVYDLLQRLYLRQVIGDLHVKLDKEHGFASNVPKYILHEVKNDGG
jgi:hypothetical protein